MHFWNFTGSPNGVGRESQWASLRAPLRVPLRAFHNGKKKIDKGTICKRYHVPPPDYRKPVAVGARKDRGHNPNNTLYDQAMAANHGRPTPVIASHGRPVATRFAGKTARHVAKPVAIILGPPLTESDMQKW